MRENSVRFILELAVVLIVNSKRPVGRRTEVRMLVTTAIINAHGNVELPVARKNDAPSPVLFDENMKERALAYMSWFLYMNKISIKYDIY